MKIAITADPEIPVPPHLYGGIERIIDGLAHQYRKAGHKVWLCAHESSTCTLVEALFAWPGKTSVNKFDTAKNALFLRNTVHEIRPDIVHSFSRLLYLYPTLLTTSVPVVQSYQRAINARSTGLARKIGGKRLLFTACARHMTKHLSWAHEWHTVYNFTDTEYFNPSTNKRTCLAFLGRIEPIKGASEAVQVALKTGLPLKIAGNVPPEHQGYFDRQINPHLGSQIEYIGPVNDEQKRTLLQGALAMLFPILWEEPFGIVMAESMACGTPVIAFNRGSVPEVIENGINGFVCTNVDEMASALKRIHLIDNQYVIKSAVQKFSANVIGKHYLNLFNKILEAGK